MSHLKHPWIFMATWFVHFNKAAWVCASQHGRDLCLSRMLGVTAGRSGNRINWTHVTWLNNTVIAVCGCILTFGSELHIHGFIQSTITMPVPQAKLLIRPYTVFYLMMFVKPYTSECHVQACKMPMACVICDPLYEKSCCYLTVSPSQVTVPDWLWKHGSTMSLGNRWKCRLSGEWMRWSSSCSPVIQGKAWVKQTLFAAGNMSSNELMFFLLIFAYFSLRSWSTNVFNFRQRCLWCLLFSISSSTCAINWAICLPWSQVLCMPLQFRHWPNHA